MSCCCNCNCSNSVPGFLYNAPESVRREYRERITSNHTRKLVDVTISRWKTTATLYRNKEKGSWVNEFCTYEDPKDPSRRIASLCCVYVFVDPDWGLQGTGYRSTSSISFNTDTGVRVRAALEHCIEQFWLNAAIARKGSGCSWVDHRDHSIGNSIGKMLFDFGCFSVLCLTLDMHLDGTPHRQKLDAARVNQSRA